MSIRPVHRRALLVPLTAATAALASCGGAPTAGDYSSGAEDFIDGGLDGQAERAGLTFADADCDDPPGTATGTIFSCSASGSDGTAYTFTVTIVGRNRMDLVSEPPLPSTSAETTVPGSAAAPGTTLAPVPATTGG